MKKNIKKYIELYRKNYDEQIKKWGSSHLPIDWNEFEAMNEKAFQKYLDRKWEDETKKTKTYLGLLNKLNSFAFLAAFQSRNCEMLNNALYQTSLHNILDGSTLASGTDHAIELSSALAAFACNNFDIIENFFPKELPLSKGTFYTEVSANLLKILVYQQNELLETALQKADKFLSKKKSLWEKYVVSYFLALINRDTEQINDCLQQLCTAYQKQGDIGAMEKCFAAEIHGLYHFARYIDEDFFCQIVRPKHDCFFEEFEIWQEEQNYPKGKIFYVYPSKMDYMNKIFDAKIPTVSLHAVKYGNRTEIYRDEDKFAASLTENVKMIL